MPLTLFTLHHRLGPARPHDVNYPGVGFEVDIFRFAVDMDKGNLVESAAVLA